MVVSFMSLFLGVVHLPPDPTVQGSKTGMQTGAMTCLERGSQNGHLNGLVFLGKFEPETHGFYH